MFTVHDFFNFRKDVLPTQISCKKGEERKCTKKKVKVVALKQPSENATHFQQICAMTNTQTNIFAASKLSQKFHIS